MILVGGLEAGIALHILNNLLAFGVAIALNQLDSTLNVSEASWWQLPLTITQNGVFLVLVLLVARKMGLRNTTAPPVLRRSPRAPPEAFGRPCREPAAQVTPTSIGGREGVCVSLTLGSPGKPTCSPDGPIPWGMG